MKKTLFFALFAIFLAAGAWGQVWNGGNGGGPSDWNVAANWSPPTVPGNGANVFIPGNALNYYPTVPGTVTSLGNVELTTGSGNPGTLYVTSNVSIANLSVPAGGNGVLDIAPSITVSVSGLTEIYGNLSLPGSGTLDITDLTVGSGQSISGGNVTMNGAAVTVSGGAVLVTSAGAITLGNITTGSGNIIVYSGMPNYLYSGYGGNVTVNDITTSTGNLIIYGTSVSSGGGTKSLGGNLKVWTDDASAPTAFFTAFSKVIDPVNDTWTQRPSAVKIFRWIGGGAAGDWTDPLNWDSTGSYGGVPSTADLTTGSAELIINDPVPFGINPGLSPVALNLDILSINSGTLIPNGNLTVGSSITIGVNGILDIGSNNIAGALTTFNNDGEFHLVGGVATLSRLPVNAAGSLVRYYGASAGLSGMGTAPNDFDTLELAGGSVPFSTAAINTELIISGGSHTLTVSGYTVPLLTFPSGGNGTLALGANTFNVTGDVTQDSGSISASSALLMAGGDIIQTGGGISGSITVQAGSGQAIQLNGPNNAITTFIAGTGATPNIVELVNTAATLTIGGISSGAGGISVDNTGAVVVANTVNATGGTVSLKSTTTISESGGGSISGVMLIAEADTSITLTGANTVLNFTTGAVTPTGNVRLENTATTLTIPAMTAVRGDSGVRIDNTGALSVMGTITTLGAGINLTGTTGISGNGAINTDNGFGVRSTIALTSASGSIELSGALTGAGLSAITTGDISGVSISLTGANTVSTFTTGLFVPPGTVTLVNTGTLTLNLLSERVQGNGVTINNTGDIIADNPISGGSGTTRITVDSGNIGGSGPISGAIVELETITSGDINRSGSISATAGDVTLTAEGGISVTGAITATGDLTANAHDGINLSGANDVGTAVLRNTNGTAPYTGSIFFNNTSAALNLTAVNGNTTAASGTINVTQSGTLTVAGTSSAEGNITLQAGGNIYVYSNISTGSTAGTRITLASSGGAVSKGSFNRLTAPNLTVNANRGISLGGAGNAPNVISTGVILNNDYGTGPYNGPIVFANDNTGNNLNLTAVNGTAAATGTIDITHNGSLTLLGTTSAGGNITLNIDNNISGTGTITTTGDVTANAGGSVSLASVSGAAIELNAGYDTLSPPSHQLFGTPGDITIGTLNASGGLTVWASRVLYSGGGKNITGGGIDLHTDNTTIAAAFIGQFTTITGAQSNLLRPGPINRHYEFGPSQTIAGTFWINSASPPIYWPFVIPTPTAGYDVYITGTITIPAGAAGGNLGANTAGTGNIYLRSVLDAAGRTVTLNAGNNIVQGTDTINTDSRITGAGSTLSATAGGAITVTQFGNLISNFTASGGGLVQLSNYAALTIPAGGVSGSGVTITNTGNITITGDITSTGTVAVTSSGGSISGTGVITAATLNADANSGITLNADNMISAGVVLRNTQGASQTGNIAFINDYTGNIDLTTVNGSAAGTINVTNRNGNLNLNGDSSANGLITLTSAGGAVTKTPAFIITAPNLTVNAHSGIDLGGGPHIPNVISSGVILNNNYGMPSPVAFSGAIYFSNNNAGNNLNLAALNANSAATGFISITHNGTLTVNDVVSSAGGNISLSGNDGIAVNDNITTGPLAVGAEITLTSSNGGVTKNATAQLSSPNLTVNAHGGISLGGAAANTISDSVSLNNNQNAPTAGDIVFANSNPAPDTLSLAAVNTAPAPDGRITITNTGNIAITSPASVNSSNGEVLVTATSGNITGDGAISGTGVTLTTATSGNIGLSGTTVSSANVSFASVGAITGTGNITATAGPGTVSLVSGNDQNITVNGAIAAGNVSVTAGAAGTSIGTVSINGNITANGNGDGHTVIPAAVYIWAQTLSIGAGITITPGSGPAPIAGQACLYLDASPTFGAGANFAGNRWHMHTRRNVHIVYSNGPDPLTISDYTGLGTLNTISDYCYIQADTPLGTPFSVSTMNPGAAPYRNIYIIDVDDDGTAPPAYSYNRDVTFTGFGNSFIEIRGAYYANAPLNLYPGTRGLRLYGADIDLNSRNFEVVGANKNITLDNGGSAIKATNIIFGGTVNGTVANANHLTLDVSGAIGNTISVAGTMGNGTIPLGDIQIRSINTTSSTTAAPALPAPSTWANTFYSAINARSYTQTGAGGTGGTGSTCFNGNQIYSGNFNFTGTALMVNNAMTVTGATSIYNSALFTKTAAGGEITATGGFVQNASALGSSSLAHNITTTAGNPITFSRGVEINASPIQLTAVNGDITLNEIVSSTGGNQTFNIIHNAGSGNLILGNSLTSGYIVDISGTFNRTRPGGATGASLIYGDIRTNNSNAAGNFGINIAGPIELYHDITMRCGTSPAGGGAITLQGNISGAGFDLALIAGTGAISMGTAGTNSTQIVKDFTVTSANTTAAAFIVNGNAAGGAHIEPSGVMTVNCNTTNNGTITAGPIASGSTAIQFNGNYTAPSTGMLNGNTAQQPDIVFGADVILGGLTQNNNIIVFDRPTGVITAVSHDLSIAASAAPVLDDVVIRQGNTVNVLTGNVIRQNDAGRKLTLEAEAGAGDKNGGKLVTAGTGSWYMGSGTPVNFSNGFAGFTGELIFYAGSELNTRDLYTAAAHAVTLPGTGTSAVPLLSEITAAGNVTINQTFNGGVDIHRSTITMTGTGVTLEAAPSVFLCNLVVTGSGAGTTLRSKVTFKGSVTIGNSAVLDCGGFNIEVLPRSFIPAVETWNPGGVITSPPVDNFWQHLGSGSFIYHSNHVEFGDNAISGHTYAIIGNTAWYTLRCHEPSANIRFSNFGNTHTINHNIEIKPYIPLPPPAEPPAFVSPASMILLTRLDDSRGLTPSPDGGAGYIPPDTVNDCFWYFDLKYGAELKLDYVYLNYCWSKNRIPLPRGQTDLRIIPIPYVYLDGSLTPAYTLGIPRSIPGTPSFDSLLSEPVVGNRAYYNVNWFVADYFFYSFTEDFDGNGRIDRIRAQAGFDIDWKAAGGFKVVVDGYDVDGTRGDPAHPGYEILPGDEDCLIIWLVEKPYPDGNRILKWSIDENQSLWDSATGFVKMNNYSPDDGTTYLPYNTVDTVPPRINYALALPNHTEIYFQMSKPVVTGITTTAGAVNDLDRDSPPKKPGVEFLVTGTSGYSASVLASAPNFTVQNVRDTAKLAEDRKTEPGVRYAYQFPSPKYPTAWDYSGYVEVRGGWGGAYSVLSGSLPGTINWTIDGGGGNKIDGANYGGVPYGDAEHRVTDLLISIPPQQITDGNYFIWPLWAKYDNPLILDPASDLGFVPLLPGYGYLGQGITDDDPFNFTDVIWDFSDKRFLERGSDIKMHSRLNNANGVTVNNPRLVYVFDLPDIYKSTSAHGSPGLWHPGYGPVTPARVPFINLVPQFYVKAPSPYTPFDLPPPSPPSFNYTFRENEFAKNGKIDFYYLLDISRPDLLAGRLDILPLPPGETMQIPDKWYTLVRPFSFGIHDITRQRGGVTILNNVINSEKRERVFIDYTLRSAGRVTIQVFTLDGNLVYAIKRNVMEGAGSYRVSWDGANQGGRPVARGMYFIRVVAPDIDEIRKVMVIK